MKKQKSSSEPSPYFAPEIVSNILLGLPKAALYNASLVCKKWFSIISNPNFLDAYHLNQRVALLVQEPSLSFFETYRAYLVTMKGGLLSKIESTRLRVTKKIVSSCKEFALIKPKVDKPYLSVFNLSTQKTHWLPHSPLSVSREYHNHYGIGFNPTTRRYKVVCFGNNIRNNGIRSEVLDQGSITWRQIDEPVDGHIVLGPSISINGFLHWHSNAYTEDSAKIISMDLDNEKFVETPVPSIYNPQQPLAFKLLEVDGCLSLIEYELNCHIHFEIWSLKDISDGMWERIFNVSFATIRCNTVLSLDDLYYVGSLYNGKFLLFKQHKRWVSKVEYFVADLEKRELKLVPIDPVQLR